MGMFDTFLVDDCDGQVKIYERNMDCFKLGDLLPHIEADVVDYGVKLRHGGWVVVKNNIFFKYQQEKPCLHYLYDKWGRYWDENNPAY